MYIINSKIWQNLILMSFSKTYWRIPLLKYPKKRLNSFIKGRTLTNSSKVIAGWPFALLQICGSSIFDVL
ncbi:hypothetical protein [African swine fever virus]|uniref:Uncharacterized protein n=1 Tax=African swine fever virus TaxID=10497 RepID=A0A6G8EYT9_ASF|nr:hypothetical protein [African swine fever virus]WHO19742.1 hypothetical protein [African swine fever virus]WHO19957.1 hypothetical protein [African swine fever virus]